VTGVTIRSEDPFATPDDARSPVRRLRGRLPAAVTLWTTGTEEWAGLTMSSTVVVDGEPGRLLGVVDEESTLWERLRETGRFTVVPLRESDRQLADVFAGVMPAPGGPFAGRSWRDTGFGPVLEGIGTWVGCRLDQARPLGWGLLVEATIEQVELAADDVPGLIHYRGRYVSGPSTPRAGR
jgi:3-hydroxy-9,10-secoandrosta-1,3,5(10)-triene-9,17-dione monooxygenase reductase component